MYMCTQDRKSRFTCKHVGQEKLWECTCTRHRADLGEIGFLAFGGIALQNKLLIDTDIWGHFHVTQLHAQSVVHLGEHLER